MATSADARAVKSLNTAPGEKRFKFKSDKQRIAEIDIDVFGVPDSAEPKGTSFFLDAFLYWRELNTAEDFISLYEEMMPFVQTLPQILLHKETIFSELLKRLKMKSRLSLEPILGLIAALARDILEEFVPFLNRIVDTLLILLQRGGERDPETLEQVFTCLSYLMKYLQRYLINNIVQVLKVTKDLRYYPKDYVQQLMAKPIAVLLRNAPANQLEKGIRKIVVEASEDCSAKKTGACNLLWCIMRGTAYRLHSRVEHVLELLFSTSVIGNEASEPVLRVLYDILQRLCKESKDEELTMVSNLIIKEIKLACSLDGNLLYMNNLLSLLVLIIPYTGGAKNYEYKSILEVVGLLVEKFILSSGSVVEKDNESLNLVDNISKLMLCLLDVPCIYNDLPTMSSIRHLFAPVFKLGSSCLVTFVKELLLKDSQVTHVFRCHILLAMDQLIESFPGDVVYLMLTFYDKIQDMLQSVNISNAVSEVNISRICSFYYEKLHDIMYRRVNADEADLVLLWGIIKSCPLIQNKGKDFSDSLSYLLKLETGEIAPSLRSTWQGILAAAICSLHNLNLSNETIISELSTFLRIASTNELSAEVLFSVAESLEALCGELAKRKLPELDVNKTAAALSTFSHNMSVPNKKIRMSTLRILSHFTPLVSELYVDDDRPRKKLKTEGSTCSNGSQCEVVQLLLSIEQTVPVSNGRQITRYISGIQTGLNAGSVCDAYVPLLVNAIIGICHNRLSDLLEPAKECLSTVLSRYKDLACGMLVEHLGNYNSLFLASNNRAECSSPNSSIHTALGDSFNLFMSCHDDSTPCDTILRLLLQSLQKVPDIVESHSQQIIQIFLRFLGYPDDGSASVGSFSSHHCSEKEWKAVLAEWLYLLKLIRNSRALFQSQFLKDVLLNRLMDESDSDVQMKVFECLLNWKDEFLLPYEHHLKKLINLKKCKDELTVSTLSRDSCYIEERHRAHLIPFVIIILVPKVRQAKHAGVKRKEILRFLAQLDVDELPLFFSNLLTPLFRGDVDFNDTEVQHKKLLDVFQSTYLECAKSMRVGDLFLKKKSGFLHFLEDLLGTFDEFRIKPFLNVLLTIAVRILESCSADLGSAKGIENFEEDIQNEPDAVEPIHLKGTDKRAKKLRSHCLKIIAFVLNKYEHYHLDMEFWNTFFGSVKPLIKRFKQECSNSEKPSSLLSCFIAMSRHSELVPLLESEDELIPTIFSILCVNTSSEAVISSVLSFIENLVNLKNDLNQQEDNLTEKIVLRHINTVILSFKGLFQRRREAHRKSMIGSEKEMRILKGLASYIREPSDVRQFVGMMLPLFGKKNSSSESLEGLHVLKVILPLMDAETAKAVLDLVPSLLVSVESIIRLSICDILDGLAAKDPTLIALAGLLRKLNATSTVELGEIDYDTRIAAYSSVPSELPFYEIEENQTLIIMSQCVYDISSDDQGIQESALTLLIYFIKFFATVWNQGSLNWSKSCIERVIKKVFLQNVVEAVNNETAVQKVWMVLLRELIFMLPGVSALGSLSSLCNEDPEADFFKNILHLQTRKRAMALSYFRNVINAGNFSETLVKKIFVPQFFKMMLDVKDGKGEHMKNAFSDTLACISGWMRWEAYHEFLIRCFRELALKPDKHKLLLQLICSVLDRFHFFDNESSCLEMVKDCESKDSCKKGVTSGNLPSVPIEIQESLQKTILPKVMGLLDEGSGTLNVSVNIVFLKLLKLLSAEAVELHLPRITYRISNFLKSRLESERHEARKALVMCIKELKLPYLQFIVKVLMATLKRGFETHVLGYTLNFLLTKCIESAAVGSLDCCLEDLLLIVMNDIFGDVAMEKEVAKIASKMKETRKSLSFETMRLISQNISFKTHAPKMLSHIKARFQKNVTKKEKTKLGNLLHHIVSGIKCNPSADWKEVLIFAYGLIEDDVLVQKSKNQNSSKGKIDKHSNAEIADPGNHVGYGSQGSHLITVFALEVLGNCLNSMKLDKEDRELLSRLDPFLKLLGDCLDSRHEDVLTAAFKCLAILIRLPLASNNGTYANKIKLLILDIVRKAPKADGLLTQSCLKLLTVLLTRTSLSRDQLCMLLHLPVFIDLQTSPSHVALSLIKQMVARKLQLPELYNVVYKMAELMITSQSEPIRKKCSRILLKFLMDYPLTEKYRQQYWNFLLENLRYKHASGREAVLEMFGAILVKFPKRVVDANADRTFKDLLVMLDNELDSGLSSMISEVIKLLISNTSQKVLDQIIEKTVSWFESKNQRVWSISTQVLALMVETHKEGLREKYDVLLQVAKHITGIICGTADKGHTFSDIPLMLWKSAYHSVVMLEKMLLRLPDLYSDPRTEVLWDNISKFLCLPNVRLRTISNHLIALYFQRASDMDGYVHEMNNSRSLFLMNPCRLFKIAVSFCNQLQFEDLDDAISNLIVQNLVYSMCRLHSFTRSIRDLSLHEYWTSLNPDEQNCYIGAFDLFGSTKVKNSFLLSCTDETSMTPGIKRTNDVDATGNLQSLIVVSVLKKMAKIAFLRNDVVMKAVFNCYKDIMLRIDPNDRRDYAAHVIEPLYKVCEGFSGREITDGVKDFTERIRHNIQKLVGDDCYIEVYNLIRRKLKEKRDKRRQEQRIMAAKDPVSSAKRRLKLSVKNKANKKRKIMGMKMLRRR